MSVLYRRSLYVRNRRHTSARQARQDGHEYRPRRPARLDQVHQASAPHHWAILCATALAPRSDLHRTSRMRSSLAHIDHLRRRRRLAARGGERDELLRDLWSGALHEVAEFALAVRWVRSRRALVPRRTRVQRTDAAWQRSNTTKRSIRNQFVAQIHVRFAAVSRLSRGCLAAVSRCLALSRAVSRCLAADPPA